MTDCSICLSPVIDYPAPTGSLATGSHHTSCGHTFHPKCIWKWYTDRKKSTCPICRKGAVEEEGLAPESEPQDASDAEEQDAFDDGGAVRITLIGMEILMYQHGARLGVTPSVREEVGFDEFSQAIITRYEFERILTEQDGNPFSDAEWNHISAVYPLLPDDDGPAVPRLTLSNLEPEAAPPPLVGRSDVAREDEEAWALILQSAHANLERYPLPVVEEEAPRFTLERHNIQGLLQQHGSSATVAEFFNEDLGDEDETHVINMTAESLNARFASLGATCVDLVELVNAHAPFAWGARAPHLHCVEKNDV